MKDGRSAQRLAKIRVLVNETLFHELFSCDTVTFVQEGT